MSMTIEQENVIALAILLREKNFLMILYKTDYLPKKTPQKTESFSWAFLHAVTTFSFVPLLVILLKYFMAQY